LIDSNDAIGIGKKKMIEMRSNPLLLVETYVVKLDFASKQERE